MSHEEHAIFESMVSHDHSTVLETESGQLIFVDDMPRLAADDALHSAHAASEGSDATNRSLQHICFKSFIFYTVALAALRTGVLHPMTLTVTRKMTAPQDAAKSTQTILRELAARPGGPLREWTRGMLAAVLGCSASDALYYGVYEPAKHYMTQRNYSGAAECASGYVGDVVSRSLHTPAMVIMTKQVLQPATERPLGLAGMVRHTYQTGGTKALFRGFTASVAAGSPWSALWWLAYERSKAALYGAARASPVSVPERWKRRLPATMTNLNDNGLLNAGASMLASASTAVMFNPFLVVRARQQQLNMSIRHAARLVRQEGGWRGYMAGVQLSVASCVVDGILISYTYELAKSLAEIKHPSK